MGENTGAFSALPPALINIQKSGQGAKKNSLPKELKEFTVESIAPFKGIGEEKKIYIALLGNVYDVTEGSKFYGPGGPYASFAGTDATRRLASYSLIAKKNEDTSQPLTEEQMEKASHWEVLFKSKYQLIGYLKTPSLSTSPSEATAHHVNSFNIEVPQLPKKSKTCSIL